MKPKSKPKHTPTPWQITDYQGDDKRVIIGPDNELIADCYPDSSEDYNIPENYMNNAALILRAVNSHEGLLGFVKMIMQYVEENEEIHGSDAVDFLCEMSEIGKAIIKKAEGK